MLFPIPQLHPGRSISALIRQISFDAFDGAGDAVFGAETLAEAGGLVLDGGVGSGEAEGLD